MYRRITELSRGRKKLLILLVDSMAILVAIVLAIMLRLSDPWPAAMLAQSAPFYVVMLGLGLIVAPLISVPQTKITTFDLQGAAKVGLFALLLAVGGTVLNAVFPLGAPRTVPVIFGLVVFCLSVGWKLAASMVLDRLHQKVRPLVPVAVYGAGAAGIQLISGLMRSHEFRVVAVVDDNPGLRGVVIGGLRVQPAEVLDGLAAKGRIARILLALPSVTKTRQREIVRRLERLPCEVQALPAYADIIGKGGLGGDLTTSLKPVSSDDLLGRDAVDLASPEVARAYRGRSVLVSGAGGSIGSELCRQLLGCGPRRLVLFERSEFALYTIDRELGPLAREAGVELVSVLGSVGDRMRVARTLERQGVEIVLHAAAYKHVPLVEANELEGVRNNVFGTKVLAEAARAAGVERFILVSTDKAVRPANVMGATKRLAEMVVQDLARRPAGTRFAMVRFGNVLGSSGSVIPLFQSQIANGGPVTVTHAEVTRFFMTIPEASRLVLLAGSYAEGGEVFVLDMGRPVKILDLARRMVELSGLTVRDAAEPDGDIAIEITGLRPGEKLYEELLIGEEGLMETPHPKILRAGEGCPSELEIATILQELRTAAEQDSPALARRQIEAWVEGFHHTATPTVAAE